MRGSELEDPKEVVRRLVLEHIEARPERITLNLS